MDVVRELETPVLIVGGGPVGLAAALELAYHGVRSTLVERSAAVSVEPLAKAGTLSARTLEFCRRWGIADQVSNWGADPDFPRDSCYVTALNGGHLLARDALAPASQRHDQASPEMLRKCPQHVFDPILVRAIEAAGRSDLRYGTEVRGLSQDDDGVSVHLVDLARRRSQTIRADYVLACDGAASTVRGQLGIGFDGPTLDYSISALIRIVNLDRYHSLGRASRYLFIGPDGTWANLTSIDYGDLWRFTLLGLPADQSPERIDLSEKIAVAFGRDDVPLQLMRPVHWRRSRCTASSYRSGRVFLAGDSAHTMSPTGGHGLNTGLGDVVGLVWMLAANLQGWAGTRLLEAYEVERRPVALRNGESASRNFAVWQGEGLNLSHVLDHGPAADAERTIAGRAMIERLREEWHPDGVRMGYRYEGSPLIVPDGTPEPADTLVDYHPTARPGHRAPHAWIGPGQSVIDLFGPGFTLLKLGPAPPDSTNLEQAARQCGVPLTGSRISGDEIAALYERALVLVRPDGHVAWRSDLAPDPAQARQIIAQVRGDLPP